MQRVWSTYYNNEQAPGSHLEVPLNDGMFGEDKNSHRFSHRPNSTASSQSAHSLRPLTRSVPPQPMSDPYRLEPPNPPFSHSPSAASLRSLTPPSSIKDNVSLTVNYLPTKFSRPHSPGMHKRKGRSHLDANDVPKRGGGREAFRPGEARMPGVGDEDYDGVMPREGGKTKPRLRWNRFKWTLFVTNSLLSIYSIVGLIFCLLTWFNVWENADVIRVGNRPELILSTLAASIGIVTSLVGWSGLLLNNRAFLATYTLLLWVTFALLVVPGYVTYRRRAFNLEGKINSQWSRNLGTDGRLRIQNELGCCGYFSPFTEATVSQTCYARSQLPGCKGPYLKFERVALERWYIVVFSIVPLHLGIMISALLCSNHVTYRFGKGMMPKAYRLSLNSMAVIMDNYAQQLAEQYGSNVASDVIARSRGNLAVSENGHFITPAAVGVGFASGSVTNLDAMPTMPYSDIDTSYSTSHSHSYGQLNTHQGPASGYAQASATYEQRGYASGGAYNSQRDYAGENNDANPFDPDSYAKRI